MPEPTTAIPDGGVLLHIGPHKTGTTAIQGTLATARRAMAEHGVRYPGPGGAHHEEARAVIQRASGWVGDSEALPHRKRWRQLVRKAQTAPGRSVISSEFFALATPEQRARVIDDLGADRVHLLVAARNPGSIALSTWQQVLRDGKTGGLDSWLAGGFRRDDPVPASQGFWSWADTATLVDGWSKVLPLDRIHVVVIDERDRALLPATFERLLSLPDGLLVNTPPPSNNRSLTAAEAELLRATVELVTPELSWSEFSLFFRAGLATRLLGQRKPPSGEPRSVLPAWAKEQADREAAVSIERLRASGVHIIGDLENIRRVPPAAEAEPIDEIPVELAAQALTGVALAASRRIRHLNKKLESAPLPLDKVSTEDLRSELLRRIRGKAGRALRRG